MHQTFVSLSLKYPLKNPILISQYRIHLLVDLGKSRVKCHCMTAHAPAKNPKFGATYATSRGL